MKNKQLSMKKSKTIPNEGKGHMMKGQHTGTQKPGATSQEKGASGGKFAKGGSAKMFSFAPSKPKKPGTTGV
jgi:hypothetical protein